MVSSMNAGSEMSCAEMPCYYVYVNVNLNRINVLQNPERLLKRFTSSVLFADLVCLKLFKWEHVVDCIFHQLCLAGDAQLAA